MSVLATTHPTLLDLQKRLDPDGRVGPIIEVLNQMNPALDDIVWQEGNLPTGHRTTIRTGIPGGTWRKINEGVQPQKSTTAQITFTTGMLEAYAEVDKALADLNGNTAAWRLSEELPFIEGLSQEIMQTIFYGNEGTEPEAFTGLTPYFNSLSGTESSENVIAGGGAGTDNASVWLVGWGPNTVHGIVPKGSTAGLQQRDMGEVTLESAPNGGGRMQAYRTHYRWDAGLAVKDWRYVVRIANIDKSALTLDAATGANLINLMTQALETIQSLDGVRPVFYAPKRITTYLRSQITNRVVNSTLTMDEVAGRKVMGFGGVPVRRVDALSADEALVV